MKSNASRTAVPELIQQLNDTHQTAANSSDYDTATPNVGLNVTFTRLDSHLQGISALADLLQANANTADKGEPSLSEYYVGGLFAALTQLSWSAIHLMSDIHSILTEEKAP